MLALKFPPAARFAKTDTGREEIRARVHALSRGARNLLVILDESRPASEWLQMVSGATEGDLQDLVDAQLVQAAAERAAAAREGNTRPTSELPYADLYMTLNAMVSEQLGLIKGYRFTMEIERASGQAELEAVAQRFIEEVHKAQGDAVARQVRRTLRLGT